MPLFDPVLHFWHALVLIYNKKSKLVYLFAGPESYGVVAGYDIQTCIVSDRTLTTACTAHGAMFPRAILRCDIPITER